MYNVKFVIIRVVDFFPFLLLVIAPVTWFDDSFKFLLPLRVRDWRAEATHEAEWQGLLLLPHARHRPGFLSPAVLHGGHLDHPAV